MFVPFPLLKSVLSNACLCGLPWHWLTPFHPITGALSTITAKGLSRTVSLKGGFTFVPAVCPTANFSNWNTHKRESQKCFTCLLTLLGMIPLLVQNHKTRLSRLFAPGFQMNDPELVKMYLELDLIWCYIMKNLEFVQLIQYGILIYL